MDMDQWQAIEAAARRIYEMWYDDGGIKVYLPHWSQLPEAGKQRLRHITTTAITEYNSRMGIGPDT